MIKGKAFSFLVAGLGMCLFVSDYAMNQSSKYTSLDTNPLERIGAVAVELAKRIPKQCLQGASASECKPLLSDKTGGARVKYGTHQESSKG